MVDTSRELIPYNERSIAPQEKHNYDAYAMRMSRYDLFASYKDNTVYSSINSQAESLKRAKRLYPSIRPIYNPVKRQNDLLAGYIYGGAIDLKNMKRGAMPIIADNPAVLDALRQGFKWSRWGQRKSLFVRLGANLGDVGLKIVDDRERQKVRMEVIHPSRIRHVEWDDMGNIQSAIIQYLRSDDEDLASMARPGSAATFGVAQRKQYLYTEIITKDHVNAAGKFVPGKFSTYKDGNPFAFYKDASGNPVSEWDNEYGFVPLVIAAHEMTDMKWGANSYYNVVPKINELNDVASLADDQLRKILIPLLAATNVSSTKEIKLNTEDRDKFAILFMPEDSELTPVTLNIDLAGGLEYITSMLQEIERDLPELALQRMRDNGNIESAPAVSHGYGDAIRRIEEARGNYDAPLIQALQMLISVGGYNGYEGFEQFDLLSYERGDMEFNINHGPVIDDGVSRKDKLTFLGSVNNMNPALQRVALKEMDFDDETIEDVATASEEQMRSAVRAFADSTFNNKPKPGKNDPAEDDEEQDDDEA